MDLSTVSCPTCSNDCPCGLHVCSSCGNPIHYHDGMHRLELDDPLHIPSHMMLTEWMNDVLIAQRGREFRIIPYKSLKPFRNIPASRSLAEERRTTACFGIPPIKCVDKTITPDVIENFKRNVRGASQGAIRLDLSIERLVAGMTGGSQS